MSLPFRRRSDDPRQVHERARILAARRLDASLPARDAAWLDRHLADCPACRAIAGTYADQRLELRTLRDRQPQPPRDLWARTAAAIEAEAARSGPGRSSQAPLLRRVRPSPVPLGALAGVLVVAVVVGATLLSGTTVPTVEPTRTAPQVAQTSVPTRSGRPAPTPFLAAVTVGWGVVEGNRVELHNSTIDKVCPAGGSADCPSIDSDPPLTVDLPETDVHSLILSPDSDQIVMVDEASTTGGGKIIVVPVPTPTASPGPTPTEPDRTPPPSGSPFTTASPRVTPPPATPTPTPTPTATPTSTPTGTPSEPPGSPPPSGEPSASPPVEGQPTEIASDVIMVGEAASYSADGTWFAFSARPADGSHGSDIYVWQAGWPTAQPITTDHRSVLSSWIDGRILASRAVLEGTTYGSASPAPSGAASPLAEASSTPAPTEFGRYRPETFLIDPATLEETILTDVPAWRPSIDPTRRLAVYWDGTLRYDRLAAEWLPAEGRLVLGRWPEMPAPPQVEPGVTEDPDASGEPAASAEPTAEATPAVPTIDLASPTPDPLLAAPIAVLREGSVNEWDARWDEDGTHLAVWVADDFSPTAGTLTLRILDPLTGEPQSDKPVLTRFALPGFSIGHGRLAWATPGGENGAGSKVVVVAWTEDAIGSVETEGGDQRVVIIR